MEKKIVIFGERLVEAILPLPTSTTRSLVPEERNVKAVARHDHF